MGNRYYRLTTPGITPVCRLWQKSSRSLGQKALIFEGQRQIFVKFQSQGQNLAQKFPISPIFQVIYQGMSIENFDCRTDRTQSKPIELIGRIDRTRSRTDLSDNRIQLNIYMFFFGWFVSIDFNWFDRSVRSSSIDSISQFDWFDWSVRLIRLISSIEFDWLNLAPEW